MTTHNTSYTGQPIRVGILAPKDEFDQIKLCSRWMEPFERAGIEVVHIPVGTENIREALGDVHGLLLPGGDANIHPIFYGGEKMEKPDLRDIERDHTAIRLVLEAYKRDIPTFGICRGMQEMIVAFGGQIDDLDTSIIDHAKGYQIAPINEKGQRNHEAMDTRVHEFEIQAGGILAGVFNEKTWMVNSIHGQGITLDQFKSARNKRLRDRFRIEALAPDGVVEAISAKEKQFFLGVQPHFELEGPMHEAVFGAFFRNIHQYAQRQHIVTACTDARP